MEFKLQSAPPKGAASRFVDTTTYFVRLSASGDIKRVGPVDVVDGGSVGCGALGDGEGGVAVDQGEFFGDEVAIGVEGEPVVGVDAVEAVADPEVGPVGGLVDDLEAVEAADEPERFGSDVRRSG